jgi:hypothetical protein
LGYLALHNNVTVEDKGVLAILSDGQEWWFLLLREVALANFGASESKLFDFPYSPYLAM